MKFPKELRHNGRGKVLANIYKRKKCYRVTWRERSAVDGKSKGCCKEFRTYAKAKRFGDDKVTELARGRAVGLTTGQVTGAVAAFKLLQDFNADTNADPKRRVRLLDCVVGHCGAVRLLRDRKSPLTVTEALDAYLSTVATVKDKGIVEAVDDWIADRKSMTVAKPGKPGKPDQRPQLSSGYHYNTKLVLREFAMFTQSPQEFAKTREELATLTKGWKEIPVRAIRDLTKDHLDSYMALHAALAPKSRNERRMTLRMFLKWCTAKDYLPATHRLFEAPKMKSEQAEPGDIECYTAEELRAMLERASKRPGPPKEGQEPEADCRHLLPIVALVGLGGVRLQEATRLTWEDVWHVEGHVEVSVAKSKTRARRLATVCPALAAWLEDYRDSTGPLWAYGLQHFHKSFERMLAELEIPVRRNALRHAFISAHFAAHSDEGLTAKEAGNSPGVVHKNYKGLMTKKAGEAWLAVAPARPGNVVMLSGTARQK